MIEAESLLFRPWLAFWNEDRFVRMVILAVKITTSVIFAVHSAPLCRSATMLIRLLKRISRQGTVSVLLPHSQPPLRVRASEAVRLQLTAFTLWRSIPLTRYRARQILIAKGSPHG